MDTNFTLKTVKYLKLRFTKNEREELVKLVPDKYNGINVVASCNQIELDELSTPQKVRADFICPEGIYKAYVELLSVYNENGCSYFVLTQPDIFNYYNNRDYYRLSSEYECIYTVNMGDKTKSFNTHTCDISVDGLTLLLPEIAVSEGEMSVLIFFPKKEMRIPLQFVRCVSIEGEYRLLFDFEDISVEDYNYISELCSIEEQKYLSSKTEYF